MTKNINLTISVLFFSFLTIGQESKDKIYADGKEFIFALKINKDGERLKLDFKEPRYEVQTGTETNKEEFDNAWELGKEGNIVFLGLEVMGGITNGTQKTMRWNYYNADLKKIKEDVTGLIENDTMVWLHPPRHKYFKILEINPFPEVRHNQADWSTSLDAGGQWGNERWATWEGNLRVQSEYKIKNGKISATAKTEIGDTALHSEFDSKKGFTKLDYTNIDGSHTVFDLVEIKE